MWSTVDTFPLKTRNNRFFSILGCNSSRIVLFILQFLFWLSFCGHLLAYGLLGGLSFWRTVLSADDPFGGRSCRRSVLLAVGPVGGRSSRWMVLLRMVPLADSIIMTYHRTRRTLPTESSVYCNDLAIMMEQWRRSRNGDLR